MASRKIEDSHKMLLDKLLYDAGLECIRSAQESIETSSESEEMVLKEQTDAGEEQQIEEAIEEELKSPQLEVTPEEQPEIFPTPSLRRVLPDKVRSIQEYNKVHVLPEEFKTDVDPNIIPKIKSTPQQKYIDILGDITGCTKYKKSLAEFWFLDTLANLIRRAQEDNMSRPSQAILILWFCEWMKEIQHFDAADRQRMMKRLKENMISAARFIEEEEHLPTPQQVNVYYKAEEDVSDSVSQTTPKSKHFVSFEGAAYECSMLDLTHIIHYIFDLFSTDYQYDLVRSVFTFTPEYTLIDAPFQMHHPKRMFAPLKTKPKKEKSPKKEKLLGKAKKKEPDNEEYLALLELRAREEREQEEQEDKDREAWNLKSHILPLSLAADDDFFNKYWPPPPPEPEPEPVPEVKGKAKGKGKK
ncbi:unnamed protein product, partial [Brenthis ino]